MVDQAGLDRMLAGPGGGSAVGSRRAVRPGHLDRCRSPGT